MANKFLQGGTSNVTDGSTHIVAASLSALNLDTSSALKTNSSRQIISTDLAIADTINLQATLDAKLSTPMIVDLDMGTNAITNTPSVSIITDPAAFTAKITYTGTSDITYDLDSAGDVTGPVSSTDTALVRFNGTSGLVIQDSVLTCDASGDISKSGASFISEPTTGSLVIGTDSGSALAAGVNNVFLGQGAGDACDANSNVFVGQDCGNACTSQNNTCVGASAMDAATTAQANVCFGASSGGNLSSGDSNTFLGTSSGLTIETGTNNIMIDNTGASTSESSTIRIGDTQTACHIVGIDGASLTGKTTYVIIDGNDQLVASEFACPPGYLSGFAQANTSTTVASFGLALVDSVCRSSDGAIDLHYNGVKTITLSTTGVGGITDTQDPASADQAYEVYVIGDSTGVNATEILAVEQGTDPGTVAEFVSDYDKHRRIGWFRTLDGAATIIPYQVGGQGRARSFYYIDDRVETTVLFAGSSLVWVDMTSGGKGVDAYTAPGASSCILRIAFGAGAGSNDEAAFRLNGTTVGTADTLYTHSHGSPLAGGELADTQLALPLGSDRIIEYELSSAFDLYAYVSGFMFGL